jgi:hypothetical protein
LGQLCRALVTPSVRSRPSPIDHKIAAVSDSAVLSIAPQIAKHFVKAEFRHFNANEREAALAWLRQ